MMKKTKRNEEERDEKHLWEGSAPYTLFSVGPIVLRLCVTQQQQQQRQSLRWQSLVRYYSCTDQSCPTTASAPGQRVLFRWRPRTGPRCFYVVRHGTRRRWSCVAEWGCRLDVPPGRVPSPLVEETSCPPLDAPTAPRWGTDVAQSVARCFRLHSHSTTATGRVGRCCWRPNSCAAVAGAPLVFAGGVDPPAAVHGHVPQWRRRGGLPRDGSCLQSLDRCLCPPPPPPGWE